MKDIKSVISYDTTGAVSSVNALTAALNKYNAAAKKIGGAKKTNTGMEKAAKDANLAAAAAKSYSSANKAALGSSKAVSSSAAAGMNKVTKTTNQAKEASKGLLLSWESMARIGVMQVVHSALSKVVSGLREATQASRDFGIAIGEIQTIGPQFDDFDKLADKLRELSNLSGIEIQDVSAGMYQTLSNQVTEAGHSFEFLQTAADLAIAGVGSLEGSVNLLSSTLNSYGKSASEAEKISDQLFKAVELGRFKIEDIANVYGRVAGLASAVGVSTEELATSLAVLTSTGMPANEAMTLINNTMLKMIKPTKAMKEAMAEMGIASAEAGIAAHGFQGFLKKLADHSGSSASELGKLFGRIRAVRGALGLSVTTGEKYQQVLTEIENSAGATAAALEKIQDTDAKKLNDEYNTAKNSMIEFGDSINGVILTLMNLAGGGAEAMTVLSTGFSALTIALIAVKAEAIAAGLAFMFTGAGAAIAGVTVAVMALVVAYNHLSNAAEESAQKQQAAQEAAIDAIHEKQMDNIDRHMKADKAYGAQQLRNLEDIASKARQIGEETRTLKDVGLGGITLEVENQISALSGYFKFLNDQISLAAKSAAELPNKLKSIKQELTDFDFNVKLEGLDDAKKYVALMAESTRERQKTNEAIREGRIEDARAANARARSLAAEANGVAKALASKDKIRASTEAERRTLEDKINIEKAETIVLKANAEIVKKSAASNKALLLEAESISKRIAELNKEFGPELSESKKAKIISEVTALGNRLSKINEQVGSDGLLDQLNIPEKAKQFALISQASGKVRDAITGDVASFGEAYHSMLTSLSEHWVELGATGIKHLSIIKAFNLGDLSADEAAKSLAKVFANADKAASSMKTAMTANKGLSKQFAIATGAIQGFNKEIDKAIRDSKAKIEYKISTGQDTASAQAYRDSLIKMKTDTNSTMDSLKASFKDGTLSVAQLSDALVDVANTISKLPEASMSNSFFGKGEEAAAKKWLVQFTGTLEQAKNEIKTFAKEFDGATEHKAFGSLIDKAKSMEDIKLIVNKIETTKPKITPKLNTNELKKAEKLFPQLFGKAGAEGTKAANKELKKIGEPLEKDLTEQAKKARNGMEKELDNTDVKIKAIDETRDGVESAKKSLDSVKDKTVKITTDASSASAQLEKLASSSSSSAQMAQTQTTAGQVAPMANPYASGQQADKRNYGSNTVELNEQGQIIKNNMQLYQEYADMLRNKIETGGGKMWGHELDELQRLKKAAENLPDKDIKITASGDAKEKVVDTKKSTEELKDKDIKLSAEGNIDQKAKEAEISLSTVKDKTVKIDAQDALVMKIQQAKLLLDQLQNKTVTVNVDMTQIQSLKTAFDSLVDKILMINVIVGDYSGLLSLQTALAAVMSKTVTVRANVHGQAAVDALSASIAALHGKTITITTIRKTVCVSVGCGGSGSGSDIASANVGRLYRANGGERGTDTIPAMLSPGEFVVNAGATKRMYSQLVGANAKSNYLGNTNNSTTFNNNFNISGSDAPQQTAREIQKLLRRENRIRK